MTSVGSSMTYGGSRPKSERAVESSSPRAVQFPAQLHNKPMHMTGACGARM